MTVAIRGLKLFFAQTLPQQWTTFQIVRPAAEKKPRVILSGAEVRQLAALYGLSISEPSLAILMRHRAVLFGLLGLFFLFAAFSPRFQTVAFIVARVLMADIVALVCLIVGAAGHAYVQSRG